MTRPKHRKSNCSREKSTSPVRRNACPTRPDSGLGTPTVGCPASRAAWLSVMTPSPATLITPERAADRGQPQRLQPVVLVHELQPGVEPQHGGQRRQPEVVGHRGAYPGADEVGQPQRDHLDVRAAPGEPAHVALDLDGVLAQPARGITLGPVSSVNIAGSRGWTRTPLRWT
jgi:hypothetical protein